MKKILSVKFFLLITLISFFTWACNKSESSLQGPSTGGQLIIIGIDVSQTFIRYPRIEPKELQEFCSSLSKNGKRVAIYLAAIGNPPGNPFLKARFFPLPGIDRKETLSTQKEKTILGNKITEKNKAEIKELLHAYRSDIFAQPYESNTDLEGFFQKAKEITRERQYAGFSKTIYLYTDGVHSIGQRDRRPVIDKRAFEGTVFYSTGITDKKLLNALRSTPMESPSAFFENLLFTIKN